MSIEVGTGRKSGLSATGVLFAAWTVVCVIKGASLAYATRGAAGLPVGAAMGFAVAMFPALLFWLARKGLGAFAARIVRGA